MTDQRRITLVARNPKKAQRDWDLTNPVGSHIIFVDSLAFLPHALDRGVKELAQDVERVIIDGTGTALQFLEFLSTLPSEFTGDVLSINEGARTFLSSVGRGDGRVLYALSDEDLDFYMQAHALTFPSGEQLKPRQFALA